MALKVFKNLIGKKVSQKNINLKKPERPTLDFTKNYRTMSGAIDVEAQQRKIDIKDMRNLINILHKNKYNNFDEAMKEEIKQLEDLNAKSEIELMIQSQGMS